MDIIAKIEMTLFNDRDVKKFQISFMKGGRIFGFIKPVKG